MKEYQPFPISNFRVGFDEAVEPWLLPRDAFQVMKNAHLYRGVVEKINGYNLYAKMSYRNQMALTGVIDGANKTFTGTLATDATTTNFYAQASINATMTSLETWQFGSYNGAGTVINLISNLGGTGTYTIATRAVSLTFNTAPSNNTFGGVQYNTVLFQWDSASLGTNSIMGIKQYFNTDGTQEILVFDQDRLGKVIPLQGNMIATQGCPNAVTEIPHAYYTSTIFTGNGGVTYTGTLQTNIVPSPGTAGPFRVNIAQYLVASGAPVANGDIHDNGAGQLIGPSLVANSSFINYSTGEYTLTFTGAIANTSYFDAVVAIYGTIFTGQINNFFTLSNYLRKAVFTNFVDPPMYYDGVMINYLNTNFTVKKVIATSGVPEYDINKVLHVQAYRDRMLLLNVSGPTIGVLPNFIYWSLPQDPLTYRNAIASISVGNFLPASTSESIRTFGLINNDLVVRFNNSERIFRYTGDAFAPFRWDNTNNIWQCDGPYSDINYDTYLTSVGKPAIVGSDGVNAKRVDEIIPDFTDPYRVSGQAPVPFMNQTNIAMAYGERFDDIKEGWLCYRSAVGNFPQPSDHVLAFNYLDNTYSIYTFPFSCLGFGSVINAPTWGTIEDTWEDSAETWCSYSLSINALLDLGGDHADKVFELNVGNSLGDDVSPVLFDVITMNFNPYIEAGELARFGYVDLFLSSDVDAKLRIQFFKNDNLYIDPDGNPAGYYQESIIELNPTSSVDSMPQTKIWKRIYVGSVAQSHTIRIYQNAADFTETLDQNVKIHSIVPWFKPAGRLYS